MSASGSHWSALATFRKEWVRGHLDHQRAAEALEQARQVEKQVRASIAASADDEAARRAEENVAHAQRRLTEVAVLLALQFDRFCGLPEEGDQ
jgi:hypothetical protein